MTSKAIDFKINRLFPYNHKSTKAFVDLEYGPLILKGFRVVERDDGSRFVSLPSKFDENQEKFFPTILVRRDEAKSAIDKIVLKAYDNAVKEKKKKPAKKKKAVKKKSK